MSVPSIKVMPDIANLASGRVGVGIRWLIDERGSGTKDTVASMMEGNGG